MNAECVQISAAVDGLKRAGVVVDISVVCLTGSSVCLVLAAAYGFVGRFVESPGFRNYTITKLEKTGVVFLYAYSSYVSQAVLVTEQMGWSGCSLSAAIDDPCSTWRGLLTDAGSCGDGRALRNVALNVDATALVHF